MRFVPGGAPEVRVHAQFTLVNSGTTDLQFLDVNLPNEKDYGRADLRAELDGQPATLAPLPEEYQSESPNALRLAFDPAWKQGKTIQVVLDYAFRTPADSGTRISLGADTFHLGSRGWFPELLPPKHFMSPNPARPDKSEYAVRVPSEYFVLARGALVSRKKGRRRDHLPLSPADGRSFAIRSRGPLHRVRRRTENDRDLLDAGPGEAGHLRRRGADRRYVEHAARRFRAARCRQKERDARAAHRRSGGVALACGTRARTGGCSVSGRRACKCSWARSRFEQPRVP